MKKFQAFVTLTCSMVLFAASAASASTVYIRDGANGNGSSWSNAMGDLPSTMKASDTYYVAAGVYRSGSIAGIVKRATNTDHGSDAGWQNTYDGQARFNAPLSFDTNATVFDGQTWEGFKVTANSVTGGCAACGSIRISGDNVTIRNFLLTGSYSGGFGHSVGLTGSNTTFDRSHFYKSYFEDTFGGEPKGTFTLRSSVVQMPDSPNDGVHRDVFNPYTGSTQWNLVVEDSIFNDIWLFSFLMQDSSRMGDITIRRNVFANGGGHVLRFGSGNGGAKSILIEHNTFYNIVAYEGGAATKRNNIYAKSSGWKDAWGGDAVHLGALESNSVFLIDPTDFINVNNPLGADGEPGTSDDGFRLKADSRAIGTASDKSDIGAYQYAGPGDAQLAAPRNLRIISG